jgi:hypothetical protein
MCVVNKYRSSQHTANIAAVVRLLNNPVANCTAKRSLPICPACEIIRDAQRFPGPAPAEP